jgi:hypothetical protein
MWYYTKPVRDGGGEGAIIPMDYKRLLEIMRGRYET